MKPKRNAARKCGDMARSMISVHHCNRPHGHKGPHRETTVVSWPNRKTEEGRVASGKRK